MDFDELLIAILGEVKHEMVRQQIRNLQSFVIQYNLTDAEARRSDSAELIFARSNLEIKINELKRTYCLIEPDLSNESKNDFENFFRHLYAMRDELIKKKAVLRRR